MAEMKLEEIVEKITERVAERLKEMNSAPERVGEAVACPAGSDVCVYCGLCSVKRPEAVRNIMEEGAGFIVL